MGIRLLSLDERIENMRSALTLLMLHNPRSVWVSRLKARLASLEAAL